MALLILLLALPAAAEMANAKLSEADRQAVKQVQAYLLRITTLTAKFVQIDPNGALSRGDLYLRRPGRLRFEYAPPTPILVVADGVWLILFDKELQQANRWPVGDTPLGVLVAEEIDLLKDLIVDRVERRAGSLKVRLRDPDRPDEGSLELVFATPALELRNWQATDAQGGITNVTLSEVQHDVTLDPKLFVFHDPDPDQDDPSR